MNCQEHSGMGTICLEHISIGQARYNVVSYTTYPFMLHESIRLTRNLLILKDITQYEHDI